MAKSLEKKPAKKRAAANKATQSIKAETQKAARARVTATKPKTRAKAASKPRTSAKGSAKAPSGKSAAKKPVARKPAVVDPGALQEEIARLAYHLWEQRGRPFGSPDEDWQRAKQQLLKSIDE